MKTYQDVISFVNVATTWASEHKNEGKFHYALRKMLKQCDAIIETYREKSKDADIEYCLEDDKKAIETNAQGGFKFSKSSLRARDAAVRALGKMPVTITPFIAKTVPLDLSYAERDVFDGFVLPEGSSDVEPEDEQTAKSERTLREAKS